MRGRGWMGGGGCGESGGLVSRPLKRSPLMSSIAMVALSRDWIAEEWTEAILSLMLVRYSGRLRATLRSWRATTYPTAQMMVKARVPGIATARTRGTRRDAKRVPEGGRREES